MKNLLSTVVYAKTNEGATNECYNEKYLSIYSRCYNRHGYYNEREEILSADVARACARRVGLFIFSLRKIVYPFHVLNFFMLYYGMFDYSFHQGKIVYAFHVC